MPEACDATSSTDRWRAVEDAVAWIVDNQSPDGRFLYRYDAEADVIEPGYNWVRHAGTMFALEQAVIAGHREAAGAVVSARRAIDAQLVARGEGDSRVVGVRDGSFVSTGGSALFLLALTEPMTVGRFVPTEVDLAHSLARHLIASIRVDDDGMSRVLESADGDLRFRPGVVGRFTTGEVAFALARMERLFPGEGWGDHVPGIVDYLARRKAVEEGFVPDMADHWAAYAFAESTLWSEPANFDEVAVSWARKQMGISSVMIRYEAQRTNGAPDVWLRGSTAVGSAVGTHGEAMNGWIRFFAALDADDPIVDSGRARLACNVGTLVDRRVDEDESRSFVRPGRVAGSWLWFGVTQVDDQQHALSAIVGSESLLERSSDPRPSRRQPLDWSWPLVTAAAFVVASPGRWSRASIREPGAFRRATVFALFIGVIVSVSAPNVLAALDVSVPTAAVACGVVVVLSAVGNLFGWARDERAFMALARADLVLLTLACGGGGRSIPVAVGLAGALVATLPLARAEDDVRGWFARVAELSAVAVGVALIVNGVYSV